MSNLKPYRLQSISELHRVAGYAKPQHPLISILNFGGMANSTDITSVIFDFYVASMKRCCDILITQLSVLLTQWVEVIIITRKNGSIYPIKAPRTVILLDNNRLV